MIYYLKEIKRWTKILQKIENQPSGLSTAEVQGVEPYLPQATIIVCLHNEADKIDTLLKSLNSQDMETLLVLDHCTDQTRNRIEQYPNLSPNIRIIENHGRKGKKSALHYAISQCSSTYIICTDADCSPAPSWAKEAVRTLTRHSADLLLMPVTANNTGKALWIALFDHLSLQQATAACALSGNPTMANGANMAFRRDIYLKHDARTEYASGDDMFLLHWAKANNCNITYGTDPSLEVATSLATSLGEYISQHARWLHKGLKTDKNHRGYTDKATNTLATHVAIANLCAPALSAVALCLLTANKNAAIALTAMAAILFGIKTFREYKLLKCSRHSNFVTIPSTILFALLYPMLMVIITVKALFLGHHKW